LAGAFNSQVLREAEELSELLRAEGKSISYYLIGRKAQGYFAFRRRAAERTWIGETENPVYSTAKEISDELIASFIRPVAEGGVQEIHLVYNRLVSMVSQVPQVTRLLPLQIVEGVADANEQAKPLYEFEPEADVVLDKLLPDYIESRIFNAMLASAAA